MTEKKNRREKKKPERSKSNFRRFSYGSPTQRNVPRSPRE